jgi:hypothetical protein
MNDEVKEATGSGLFLGEPIQYWVELQQRVNELEDPGMFNKLLLENARLRGALEFTRRRVEEIELTIERGVR